MTFLESLKTFIFHITISYITAESQNFRIVGILQIIESRFPPDISAGNNLIKRKLKGYEKENVNQCG